MHSERKERKGLQPHDTSQGDDEHCKAMNARLQDMLHSCTRRQSPVRLAASHNLFEVHNVGMAALLQYPDLSHGRDWDACRQML